MTVSLIDDEPAKCILVLVASAAELEKRDLGSLGMGGLA